MDITGSPGPEAGASAELVARLATMPDTVLLGRLPNLPNFGERPITVDQTHRSVVVGETVVVKWFRPAQPPPHRAVEILAHLAEAGFSDTAQPYAAVFDGSHLTALVTAYLPDALDGWDWCVEAANAGEPIGARLGELVAALHAALATPTAVEPMPVNVETDPGRHARALAALDEAIEVDADTAWLAGIADRLRADLAPLADTKSGPMLRIHGDLHVGQVLRWRHGYAIIDFDGNPTLGVEHEVRQPVARDVAQMTTSIAHVGRSAVRRGMPDAKADAWVRATVADFRSAYAAALDAAGCAYLFDPDLVRPFEVEQECRELIYAARYLPRWRYAPVGVLNCRYPAAVGPT